jgi:hypothetical protein
MAVMCVALSGFGSSAGAASSSAKQRYIAKLDLICRHWDAKVFATKAPTNAQPNRAGFERYRAWGKRFSALWGEYDNAIVAVPAPRSAAAFLNTWTNMRKATQAVAQAAENMGPLAFVRNSPQAKLMVRTDHEFARTAAKYGFHSCGNRYRG